MAEKIQVTEEIVNKVERAHFEYNAYVNVEKSYIDEHSLDPNADAIESPVFEAYHQKTVAALNVYEEAKQEMIEEYGLENKNWNLSFKDREITVW